MNDYSGANLGGDFAMNMLHVAVLSNLEAQNTSLLLLHEKRLTRELSPHPANPNSLNSIHKVPNLAPQITQSDTKLQ